MTTEAFPVLHSRGLPALGMVEAARETNSRGVILDLYGPGASVADGYLSQLHRKPLKGFLCLCYGLRGQYGRIQDLISQGLPLVARGDRGYFLLIDSWAFALVSGLMDIGSSYA